MMNPPLTRALGSARVFLVNNLPLIGPLLVWACFYLPRITSFGFDADEWVYLVHWHNLSIAERFRYLVELMSARPGTVAILSLYPSMVGAMPEVAQAVSAVLCLVIAGLIYRICLRVSMLPQTPARLVAALASITWLLIPWSLGYAAWGLMMVGLVSAVLYLLSFEIALRQRQTWVTLAVASSLQLVSYLTYESFYLYFLVALAFKFAHERRQHIGLRFILIPALWFSAAQIAAFAINRILRAGSKPITVDFAGYLRELTALPRGLLRYVAEGSIYSSGQILFCLAVSVTLLVVLLMRSSAGKLGDTVLLAATLLAMIALTVFLYSLAGYAMNVERRSSRVFLSINVLLVLLLFLIIDRSAALCSQRPAVKSAMACLLFFVPITAFAGGMIQQQKLWAAAWTAVLTTLDAAPVKDLKNLPEGSAVIYNGPTNTAGFIFLGNIELTGGIFWKYPETGIRIADADPDRFRARLENYGWFIPSRNIMPVLMFTTGEGLGYFWDGDLLTYELAAYWTQHTKVKSLYLWDAKSGRLTQLNRCETVFPDGVDPGKFKSVELTKTESADCSKKSDAPLAPNPPHGPIN